MTTTLADTTTDRHAIARALVEVEYAEHEAALWRELADFLAEPLALHNLLAEPVNQTSGNSAEVRWQNVTRAAFVPAVPFHRRDAALDTLGARVRASIEPEPDPDPLPILTDVVARRGGKYRRTNRNGWYKRLRDAWRDEIGAPA